MESNCMSFITGLCRAKVKLCVFYWGSLWGCELANIYHATHLPPPEDCRTAETWAQIMKLDGSWQLKLFQIRTCDQQWKLSPDEEYCH